MAMRCFRLVHDYFGIDLEVVWAVVERDLPRLKPQMAAILRGLEHRA